MRISRRDRLVLPILAVFMEAVTRQGLSADVPAYDSDAAGAVNGELRKWHKVTLGFTGPETSETAETNPFTDYRLDVTFSHDASDTTLVVPGYYAADGNAANTHATSGNVWLVHFAPTQEGKWDWSASFTEGSNVSL